MPLEKKYYWDYETYELKESDYYNLRIMAKQTPYIKIVSDNETLGFDL